MKSIFKFSIILVLLLSCKRAKEPFLGPSYISAPSDFSVTSFTGTPNPVNFLTNSVAFNATFSNSVSWTLTITGQTSGAFHKLKGISNGFTDLVWTGNHDGVVFFRKGENAVATLSFFGTSYTSSISIAITQVPDYTTCGTFALYGDFESPVNVTFPNWAKFNVSEQGVDSMAVDFNGNIVPSVQGKNYFYIRGLGTQQVFVDGIQYIGSITPVLPSDPTTVWVNMFIYGTGNPNTAVELEYQESDIDGTSNGYSGTDDDAFVAKIDVNHVGWKLFSFQYSKLVPSLNADFGGSGNKIHEPNRLRSFDLILLKKSNPDAPVEVYFDYPIITVGGPFKPCK